MRENNHMTTFITLNNNVTAQGTAVFSDLRYYLNLIFKITLITLFLCKK